MSGYGVIADKEGRITVYKDKAMLVRVDTCVAFSFWRSLFLLRGLFLRVPIRTKNNQAI